MYGLPNDVSLDFLCGKELVQLLVGVFQVQLRFDGEIQISVEGEFDHLRNGKPCNSNGLPNAAASLLVLLGQRVAASRRVGRGDVELTFSRGDVLRLKDSNQNAESYEILAPGIQIVV